MKISIVIMAVAMVTVLGCGRESKYAAPVSKVIHTNSFEDNSAGEWKPRGGAKLAVAASIAHTGKSSIRIFNRSEIFSAPEMDITKLTATPGAYGISCWVYVPKGSEVSSLQLTTEATTDAKVVWAQINKPIPATQENWVKVSGTLNRKPGLDKIVVYVEPLNKTGDFYVDDVEITSITQ
jgi:hypothetical protein